MSRGVALAAALLAVLLWASPAAAENPLLDPEDDGDIVAALAAATARHEVCYGYVLQVRDTDTGIYTGTYTVTGAGVGVPPSTADCPRGSVLLYADLRYVSELSESGDSAAWQVASTLGGPRTADLERQGLSASDLTDDDSGPTTLRNAVLALPALTAAQNGLPPLVLEPNTTALPPDAVATDSPASDWLRQSAGLLVLCALVVAVGLALLVASFRSSPRPEPRRQPRRQPRSAA